MVSVEKPTSKDSVAMHEGDWPTLDAAEAAIQQALARTERRPFVLGLCGAQGSGKSTLANGLATRLGASGIETAVLSIDDLYMTRAAREMLGRDIHPLLRTRGVPGTHDVFLGLDAIAALDRGEAAELPRFDKSRDDRVPRSEWSTADAGTDVVILEGWCVGARPEEPSALLEPVNALERDEDPQAVWRTYVNQALAGDYQALFARLDYLIILAAPGFDIVRAWRIEQEHALRDYVGASAPGVMTDAQIGRFIQHYERLTRHILAEMPERADLTIQLAENRAPVSVSSREPLQGGDIPETQEN